MEKELILNASANFNNNALPDHHSAKRNGISVTIQHEKAGKCIKMRELFSGYGKAEKNMGMAPIPSLHPFTLNIPYN